MSMWSGGRDSVRQFRQPPTIDGLLGDVIARTSYDADFATAMTKRDDSLIAQEVLHGGLSKKYLYNFPGAGGAPMVGISVVGARELAYHYGGISHSILGVTTKRGAMFQFESYIPFDISVKPIPELARERDFVTVRIRMVDTKKANSVEVIHTEMLHDEHNSAFMAKHPSAELLYDRPHAQTIALSKAYRNGVRTLVPQHVQIEWIELNKGVSEDLTTDVLAEKRAAVQRYAASKGLTLDRQSVERITIEQISGLSDAVREGNLPAFQQSCQALGLIARPPDGPRDVTATSTQRKVPVVPSKEQQELEAKLAGAKTEKEQQSGGTSEQIIGKIDTNVGGTFEAYLVDHTGEPVENIDDQTGEITQMILRNPVDFANWLASVLHTSANPDALFENNKDSIDAARGGSGAAAKIIDDAEQQMHELLDARAAVATEQQARLAAEEAEKKKPTEQKTAPASKDMQFATRTFIPEVDAVKTADQLNELMANKIFRDFADKMMAESPTVIYPLLKLSMDECRKRLGLPPLKAE